MAKARFGLPLRRARTTIAVRFTGWRERATSRFNCSHLAVIGSAVWLGVGNAIRHGQRVSTTLDHVP